MSNASHHLLIDKIFLLMMGLLSFIIICIIMWYLVTVGTCSRYKYSPTPQTSAQKDLFKYPGLDGDNDGYACNSYFKI